MLDLPHLGHQIGRFDHPLMGIAPGQHQFRFFRFAADKLQCLFDVDQTEADGAVDFVADKEVEFSGSEQLCRPDKRFLCDASVFSDVFGVDPPRSAGLEDCQERREFFGREMFAVEPPPL